MHAMNAQREDKPPWSAVPRAVREEAEQVIGARIVRAVRKYGGYGPSATFELALDNGRRAFFKGVYPLPEGSGVVWRLEEEELVYERLGDLILPWAPRYFGSIRREGWHALLIEALTGDKVPPWTRSRARRAMRSYAEFHASTVDRPLPEWLTREHHLEFTGYWQAITSDHDALARLIAICPDEARRTAQDWMAHNAAQLIAAEQPLAAADRFALLHFDTRSDNIRIDGTTLRIFDWPFACAGPPEFDFGAFAQSVTGEGGPTPEELTAWYSEVLPMQDDVLTASVVAIAGFFADRGSRPDVPGLPRLRAFQRLQLTSTLRWAARRLGLPAPAWLDSVAR